MRATAHDASEIGCIFDNTALGQAMPNALPLRAMMQHGIDVELIA
jgi:hypothetical protein